MAQMGNFTAETNEADEGFSVIPAGVYPARIVESDYKLTKDGKGKVMSLTYEILDDRFSGMKVTEWLCLEHEKQQTRIIAQKKFNKIKQVLGVATIQDTAQLHGIPLKIDVTVVDGNKGKMNNIKEHLNINGSPSSAPTTTASEGVPNGQTPATGKMPWIK